MADLTKHDLERVCFFYKQAVEKGGSKIDIEQALRAYTETMWGAFGQPATPPGGPLNITEFEYLASYCPGGIREGKPLPQWASSGIEEGSGIPGTLTIEPGKIPTLKIPGEQLGKPTMPGEGTTSLPAVPAEQPTTAGPAAPTAGPAAPGGLVINGQPSATAELEEVVAQIDEIVPVAEVPEAPAPEAQAPMPAPTSSGGSGCNGACKAGQQTATVATVARPSFIAYLTGNTPSGTVPYWLWIAGGVLGGAAMAGIYQFLRPQPKSKSRRRR